MNLIRSDEEIDQMDENNDENYDEIENNEADALWAEILRCNARGEKIKTCISHQFAIFLYKTITNEHI